MVQQEIEKLADDLPALGSMFRMHGDRELRGKIADERAFPDATVRTESLHRGMKT
jgi:hypothetical protein